MTLLIECIIFCVLFTLTVPQHGSKDPLSVIDDYPPAVRKRCEELGLITEEKKERSKKALVGKLIFCVVVAVVCALILRYFNHARSFWEGFFYSYILWLVVDWYDALVIDCIWFCHSKKWIIPGTEDMTDAYHDYWFHIKESLKGMLLGLPVCLLVGGITALLEALFPGVMLL